MIENLLKRKEFAEKPPVLLDIGASGSLPHQWNEISAYSVCLAFDGDEREFGYVEEKRKQFKKLVVVNKIVSHTEGTIDFYLTKSPYCSSTLKPDTQNLSKYEFARLFEIDKILKVQSVTLSNVFSRNNIDYIDWYKSDTQGTDLRLVKSLNQELIKKVIVYELEPGIVDAYRNEDKLHSVLQFFDHLKFIAVDANIKGSCRIDMELAGQKLPDNMLKNISRLLPTTPDWCEIGFFNSFNNASFTVREYILGWIFATIKKQHGLALEIANRGYTIFNDNDFNQMMDYTLNEIKRSYKAFTIKTAKEKIKAKLKNVFK